MNILELAKLAVTNAKGHPKTMALAMVALALLGGGKLMTENAIEPFGTALSGTGAFLLIVLGAIARDPKDRPSLPSSDGAPKDPP